MDNVITNMQRILYGFLNGTTSIRSDPICTNALYSCIDNTFKLVDYRFFWLPEYMAKLQMAWTKVQDDVNTAYAYCNFNQLIYSITQLFLSDSSSAQGRMVSRVISAMTEQWWYKINCMVDGYLGKNMYDVGYCAGELFTVVFDIQIGQG